MLVRGERYYAYRNLSARWPERWSLQRRGLVAGRCQSAVLRDVEFRVRPGGRLAVLESGVKGVHAFAIGELVAWYGNGARVQVLAVGRGPCAQVTYDPFERGEFYRTDTGAAVALAKQVVLAEDGRLWAWQATEEEDEA